jgi:hypothetical protein
MKPKQSVWSLISLLFMSPLCTGVATAQANERPHFVAESLSEFATAYEKQRHRVLDSEHADVHKYHAYRVSTPGSATIVTARSASIDASGHLHIVGERGTVARGQISTGAGETHILLPITVSPPQ